jgi:hypothetical protein
MEQELTPLRPFDPSVLRGVLIAPPKPEDFILGVNSPLVVADVEPSGDWSPYVSLFERQISLYLETDNCTGFSYTNDVEDQINRMIIKKQIAVEALNFLQKYGYLDENGLVNTSERALGAMAGTGPNGNYLNTVAETARKFGLAPDKMWPWDQNVQKTYEQYYAKPTQEVYDVAKMFLQYFDLPYHWIQGGSGVYPASMKVAPMYVALVTCGGWNTPPVKWCNAQGANHAVVTVKYDNINDPKIQDHYEPYIKELSLDYQISYTMQVLVIQKKGIKRMVGYKKSTGQTIYGLVNGILIPFADWDAFVACGGSSDSIVTLTDDQFAKFSLNESLLIKTNK